ncbi:hypothetical protein [Pseudescherichia sp.]|uniref:hypothetical protein n=1 Tax=Pseudescherichia sp. TaxID=2055881 RepID=UPI0028A7ED6C|nr:hypothetical protein [Pseudescherichia sp.]
MTRQSRYQSFDGMAFCNLIRTTLFGASWKHAAHTLETLKREHARLGGYAYGFRYDGEYYPVGSGVKFDKIDDLVPALHERMEDYLLLRRLTDADERLIVNWYRNLIARCPELGMVKHNLLPEVINLIESDGSYPLLGNVPANNAVLYPQNEEINKLQLKYIGLRLIWGTS